jgi:hypothetical protein
MQQLEKINEKIDLLIKAHQKLQSDNKQLQETILRQNSIIKELESHQNKTIAENGNDKSKNWDALTADGFRSQIDNAIFQIDSILTSLHE